MATAKILEVGIRIDPAAGIAFFGIEQVNQALAAGARVREVRPAGAILTKHGEDAENVTVSLGGCKIEVVLEDA